MEMNRNFLNLYPFRQKVETDCRPDMCPLNPTKGVANLQARIGT